MASSTERIRVKLPLGFEPAKHTKQVHLKISETYGDGFEIDSIETVANPDGSKGLVAVCTRQVAITQVSHKENSQTKEVGLTRGVKPGDGDKMAIKLADQHGDGWEMTRFEPYLGKAVLTKLSPETSRCRGAVSVALGVKPWEVQVSPRKDGGFELELPRTYVPSKHDSKLEEVATTVVGYDGWYVKVNTQKLTASIIPSEPPTFPAGIPTPMGKPAPFEHWNEETFKIPLGMKLPEPGETVGEVFALNLGAGSHVQVGGLSGAGKSVLINCYIAQWLSRGAELCIIDLPTKSADFEWCKEYVRPGGWGCSSDAESATVINLIMEEGERRAKLLKEVGANDWKAMPKTRGFKPIVIVVDELTGLFTMERIPKVSKNSPQLLIDMAEKAERVNFHKELLRTGIKRVAAELRFVGIFLLLASQVASANTGIDPSLRTNLHHKVLLGSKPTEGNRRLILSDPDRVPKIPDNVRDDGKAARGTGVAEPEGDEPAVFKTYFATVDQYKAWLEKVGVPKNSNPHPTKAQIAKIDDSLDEESDEAIAARRGAMRDPMADQMGDSGYDESGRPLKGAALAASQSRQLSTMGSRA